MCLINRLCVMVVIILSLLINVYPQQLIKGTVTDSLSQKPLPYASIGIVGTGKGTISNEQGNFVLQINGNENIAIGISTIGYHNKVITLPHSIDTNLIVYLTPNEIRLTEVMVVFDFANKLLDKMITKYISAQTQPQINTRSYLKLFSSSNGVTYENLEAIYTATASDRKTHDIQIENGRYGLIDSFIKRNLVYSVDFSKLITYLNLFNHETMQKANYPLFPLFVKNRKKFVDVKFAGFEDREGKVARINIAPKSIYDGEYFNMSLWINTINYNLEKVSAEIKEPIESPIYIYDKSKLDIKQLSLDIIFDSFGDSVNSYPKFYSVRMDYTIPSKDSLRVNTNVQFINYERMDKNENIRYREYASDYDLIKTLLYLPEWWKKKNIIARTESEMEINERFNRLRYYDNAFTSLKDTQLFLSKGFAVCSLNRKHLYKLASLSDEDSRLRTDSFFLIQVRNGVREKVGGLYFDLVFLYACYENQFKYVCLPVFDYKSSWVIPEYKSSLEIETLTQLLNRLYFLYSKKMEMAIDDEVDLCANRSEVERIKQNYLTELDEMKDKMIDEVWKKGEILKWEKTIQSELSQLDINESE